MKILRNWDQFNESLVEEKAKLSEKDEKECTECKDDKEAKEKVEESNKPGLEFDEISTSVLSFMKDACCGQTVMDVATALGNVKIADVHNVLTKAQKDGTIVKKNLLGKDTFEFIHKP